MSLDIYLYDVNEIEYECEECGHKKMIKPLVFEVNLTHNLGKMANACGIYETMWRPEEIFINMDYRAKDLVRNLTIGVRKLQENPSYYKTFNPENGWGNYDGLLEVASKYLEACKKYPEAEIKVSR